MKPWDPPEENLYPVLDDLLDDRMASFRPFERIRVSGGKKKKKGGGGGGGSDGLALFYFLYTNIAVFFY